jgi:hypothetical protein
MNIFLLNWDLRFTDEFSEQSMNQYQTPLQLCALPVLSWGRRGGWEWVLRSKSVNFSLILIIKLKYKKSILCLAIMNQCSFCSFCFWFWNRGLTQDFALAEQVQDISSPFCSGYFGGVSGYFGGRVSQTIYPGLALNYNPPYLSLPGS